MDVEQGLLGILLRDSRQCDRLGDVISEHSFFEPIHATIYREISSAAAAGRTANPFTLRPTFKDYGPIVDGLEVWQYLGRLVVDAPDARYISEFERHLIDLQKRRDLLSLSADLSEAAYEVSSDTSAEELIETAESALYQMAETQSSARVLSFAESLDAAIEMANNAFQGGGGLAGISTGISALDAKMGGLQASDLIVLAGRPSMGKSALATNIAFNAAKAGHPVCIFSMEMSADQLALRIIGDKSGVSSDRLRRGDVSAGQIRSAIEWSNTIRDYPIHIDQTGGLSIAQLSARARRYKRKFGLKLVVIDYLQLMRASKPGGNRVQDITEITTGLKALAKEIDLPVIALSQLSRGVEQRENKRPQLSDLRESGSIEQDADVVLFVYRDDYYLARQEPPADNMEKWAEWQASLDSATGKAEVIIGKQRHGPTGIVYLSFDAASTSFCDLAREGGAL